MRMERAAFELRYPVPRSSRRSIKAIAFASGYKSLSSFSHAFSSYARLSPREFRNEALRRKPRSAATGLSSEPRSLFGNYSIRVEDVPAREITVLEATVHSHETRRLSTLATLAATSPLGGDRYGVELLPDLLARAGAGSGPAARAPRLTCLGVDTLAGNETTKRHGSDTATRATLRLSGGRHAVIEGHGSLAQLYRAWRRGFDAWLAVSGECPKPDRVYVRFPQADVDPMPAPMALFIPLEDVVLPASKARRRA